MRHPSLQRYLGGSPIADWACLVLIQSLSCLFPRLSCLTDDSDVIPLWQKHDSAEWGRVAPLRISARVEAASCPAYVSGILCCAPTNSPRIALSVFESPAAIWRYFAPPTARWARLKIAACIAG